MFSVFRDSYVLCIYVRNNQCTFHIFMYGYVTQVPIDSSLNPKKKGVPDNFSPNAF